ncbi:hypothetical protein JIX58_15305 [Brevundimonas diminuta]|uniref:hypothetical protein n=1 Tax=Brevundimonas diminuta TaxID=293 RepID=UPI0019041932|nr:hypothetical protein [Brevundimonas diminuta]MBK1970587.1 hypothetical protein [Brevundimonas diminuta]MBK1977115.1 hypothetical protein [Brevundimonas diminuta]
MTSCVFFVPISAETAPTVIAIQALANAHGRSLTILDERVSDELLLDQITDFVVIKQIDQKAFDPSRHNLTVILPEGSEAFVQDVANRHPDMPRSWWLIHASESIATCMWLDEAGARTLPADSIKIDGSPLPLTTTDRFGHASELLLYRELHSRPHYPYDVTAQTLAHSVNYHPDTTGWHDLSGRAAHLINGPFFFLPQGNWKVDLDFDVDCDGGHIRLFFEWGAPSGHRNNFESIIKKSGNYAVTLETYFDRPDAAHCLVATNASHLQGRMRLNRCVITRLDKPANSPIPNWG